MRWLQLTAGVGPAECQWVVAQLLPLLSDEAKQTGFAVSLVETVAGEESGTLRSALLSVDASDGTGDEQAFAQSWVGTLQWIGKSRFRPKHKRRNWFVGCECFAVPEKPAWNERELEITTMRASGPGGQHVNKTESAVRVVHKPTGLVAEASEERSQQQNRRLALARLAAKFEERNQAAEQSVQQARWMEHHSLERGNALRVYEGEKFRRVR